MRGRTAGLIVTLALGILSAPLSPGAQPPAKVPRIGYLGSLPGARTHETFRQGLRDLGYVEGQNIVIEYRWAERADQFPDLADELVRLKVDLIVGVATLAAHAAKDATTTMPIVFVGPGDPVGSGLVAKLARPGGNITGVSGLHTELTGKRLELLREIVPKLSRVAMLWNSANLGMSLRFREAQAAARALGLTLQSLGVRDPIGFDHAFAAMTRERPDALLMIADTFTYLHRGRILDFAVKSRLPAIYELRELVDDGGLMSYGPNLSEIFRRAAAYVDNILKGAKPGDLPVEQPTTFELVINQIGRAHV